MAQLFGILPEYRAGVEQRQLPDAIAIGRHPLGGLAFMQPS